MTDVSQYAPKPAGEPNLADLSGAQLINYCGQAAAHMRKHAASFRRMLEEIVDENERLAADIETMAALAAKRNEMIAQRARAAAFGIRDLHAAFSKPLTVDDAADDPAADLLEPDLPQQVVETLRDGMRKIVVEEGQRARERV